jgi:hypothetical protein
MTHKVTVGLQQKIGQANFGSIGASCSIEIHLDDDDAACPEVLTSRVRQAFTQCRDCIAKELSLSESKQPGGVHSDDKQKSVDQKRAPERNASSDRVLRTATEAQVRAIRAIASKAGISLASELEQGFGIRDPNQLTIAQASQLIDSLKQGLTPSPA